MIEKNYTSQRAQSQTAEVRSRGDERKTAKGSPSPLVTTHSHYSHTHTTGTAPSGSGAARARS
jgi:hypothetical protein